MRMLQLKLKVKGEQFTMLSKNIYRTASILLIILCLPACQEEAEVYQTLCIDSDTTVKNDIPKEGILWSLSTDDFKHIMPLVKEESSRNIYIMNSITTCEMKLDNIEVDDNICKITLNAGAYGHAECSDGSKYSFGCYEKECDQYFPFPFEDEEGVDLEPNYLDESEPISGKSYTKNYKNYLNKINKKSVKDKLAVKVYFKNPNLDDSSYVVRYINKTSPLKDSIQEYLNGLTLEEKKLGFESNNFGNDSFTVKIEDNIAKIHFTAEDLTTDLRSAQQIIDFSHSIYMIADQFKTVNETEICVNDTYNYQMAFLANEDPVDCPF